MQGLTPKSVECRTWLVLRLMHDTGSDPKTR